MKTHDTMVTGCGTASGTEFRNCTCTCGTHDCDTAELPVPALHPSSVYSLESKASIFSSDGENDTTALESLYRNILPKSSKINQPKSKKRGRPVKYNGDSRTTSWCQQKKWKEASQGSKKMDTYFQVNTFCHALRARIKLIN